MRSLLSVMLVAAILVIVSHASDIDAADPIQADPLGGAIYSPDSSPSGLENEPYIPYPVRDRYYTEPSDELPYVHPPNCPCCADETPISRFRQSLYQGTSISGGYLSDGGSDALSIAHYEISARFAIPIDGMNNVVLITPCFHQDMIDQPSLIDLPDNLYVTGVSFTWLKRYSERWRSMVIVSPTVRSDFKSSEDALRIFGLGLATRTLIPEKLDFSFGVVYLDRDDIPLLPAVGLTWKPRPWWQVDLNFPRPRVAYRTNRIPGFSESWVYTGTALGGNTWSVKRANGDEDVLNLVDYQWVFGWEYLTEGGRGLFAETGCAFGRSLEYERGGENVDFDNALFIRLGMNL